MKDKLGGKITTEFIGLWPKTYSYLIDDGNNNKKVKGTKECVIKRRLKFEGYENVHKIMKYKNLKNLKLIIEHIKNR